MFEIQQKKSGRTSHGSKNHSTSRSKLQKKDPFRPVQKICLDVIKTDSYHNNSGEIRSKKSRSQCIPSDSQGKRSIDVSKFMKSTRSNGARKSRDKMEKYGKFHEQLITENRPRHDNIFINAVQTEKSAELKWIKKNSTKKNTQGRSTERKRAIWSDKCLPLDYHSVLENYSHFLTKYEQQEIREYKKVYYIGHKASKSECIDLSQSQSHFDNEEKEYRFVESDHIAYRYEIIAVIGKGSYGQVLKVFDHKAREEVALKIIKSDAKFSKQAFQQIKILSYIKERDDDQSNVVKIKDFVIFRKHVCIVFEILSDNLYELIIRNNYTGLNEELIRRFAIQILVSLQFLRNHKIIHCDLKPENILLKEYNKSGIKLIDFGSSCFEKETIYTYIQSRYYRAPEITLGIPYDHSIDIWSTGCILAELYTGVPVFPGENQMEQVRYMTDALGLPAQAVINQGSRKSNFFNENCSLKDEIKSLVTTMDLFSKPLKERIDDKDFLSFIQAFLKWNPKERISSMDALSHPWICKGLPEELKNKLGSGSREFVKSRSKREGGSIPKFKSRPKEKASSSSKLTNKSSHQKLKKSYGFKY